MAMRLVGLLALQRKYGISFKRVDTNIIELTIDKWDLLETFIQQFMQDITETDQIEILSINERKRQIVFRYDEDFFIQENGWKLWLDKYETTLNQYV